MPINNRLYLLTGEQPASISPLPAWECIIHHLCHQTSLLSTASPASWGHCLAQSTAPCQAPGSGLCRRVKTLITLYPKPGRWIVPCALSPCTHETPQTLGHTGVTPGFPSSGSALHRGAQRLSLLVQPCWCSQNIPCPAWLPQTQMGWKLHPPFHSQHRLATTSPALISMRQIIMSDFKRCCPVTMTWHPTVPWYDYAFPFYSQ